MVQQTFMLCMATMPLKFVIQWRCTMKTANTIEDEIDRIRLRIYEETKDMTPQERAERVNKIGEAAAKKYGFKFVSRANNKD